MAPMFDLAVIGGGVNGAGIARDASGRGAKVLLLERGDLATGTSSNSTKLIHGGLRYLEHYEFALVREAWDRPGLYVASVASASDDGGEHWRMRDRGCSLLRHDPPMGATTEAEALVAALEVAPGRVSP
jgi:glycine/D-amino acid oxidase-like deaminating enzyme